MLLTPNGAEAATVAAPPARPETALTSCERADGPELAAGPTRASTALAPLGARVLAAAADLLEAQRKESVLRFRDCLTMPRHPASMFGHHGRRGRQCVKTANYVEKLSNTLRIT